MVKKEQSCLCQEAYNLQKNVLQPQKGKELLVIIYCLQKARYIILGTKLTIITDNHALTFLKTCTILNNRLARWILSIQEYNFHIIHCKGSDNITIDTLSRIPSNDKPQSEDNPIEFTIFYISRDQDQQFHQDLQNHQRMTAQ